MYLNRLVIIIGFITCVLFGQSQNTLWKPVRISKIESGKAATADKSLPNKYALVSLDEKQLSSLLAPLSVKGSKPASIELPLPNGQTIKVLAKESSIWQNGTNPLIPDVKTYQLINPSNHSNAGRMTVTKEGVSGILFNNNTNIYISPYVKGGGGQHLVYDEKDDKSNLTTQCGTDAMEQILYPEVAPVDKKKELPALFGTNVTNDAILRTYRIAVAATGEYTVWAGSVANALKYITITMNNVQAIYDRECTINFTLVTSPGIIYTDSLTDPYPTYSFPASADLSANVGALNSVIGINNYDLGIVFNSKWNGGLANVGVVCNANKGGAGCGITTGTGANPTPGPQGSGMDKTAAHEIGHLYSAKHTMSAGTGKCSGNITAATAWEPGGGSTIMAYAGVCTGAAYQNSPDGYFHGGTIGQIKNYAINKGTCAVQEVTGNTLPTVALPATGYTIPNSTPFILAGYGNDIDGDSLTYTWEEMDAGVITNGPPTDTSTSGPQFRSYPPSPSGNVRIFPSLQNILLRTINPYEVLPSVGRTLNFKLTERDNNALGGAANNANTTVTFDGNSGPFALTSQSTAVTWVADGNTIAVITWNVANTNLSPVSCTSVNILFSADGGLTFPYTLASNVPNTGADTVLVPNIPTQNGRIKIESVGNIFFNINTGIITIISSCAAEGAIISPADSINTCPGSSLLKMRLSPTYSTPLVITGTLKSTDPSIGLTVFDSAHIGCAKSGNPSKYNTFPFVVNKSGTYTFTKGTGNPSKMLSIYDGILDTKSTCTGFMGSNGAFSTKNAISVGNSVSVYLVAGTSYTLVVGTFSGTSPALPSSYTINVTTTVGGKIYGGYNLYMDPGAGYGYTYLIEDIKNNTIKAFADSIDLRDSTQYPIGNYAVFGLSYATSLKNILANYKNTSLSAFEAILQQGSGGICGNLSKNKISVTISNPTPPVILAANSTTICEGDSIKFVSNKSSGNQWFKDSILLINANNQTYTTSTPGNYIVTVAYGGGCSAKSNTRKVIVNSLPTKPTITWTNNVLNSSYPSGNKWYRNDSFIIGATATIFPLPSFFTYSQCFKVKETDANGCSIFSDSACFFPGGLPIKYVGFTAFYTNGMVLLNWTTAMATSGYFEIEKSIDGVIFSAIASKQMSRNTRSVMDYTFNDKDFSPNTKVCYYRIKGVEANGTITFTKTVPVFLTQTTCKISLFPNPAHRMVSVIGLGIKEVIFTELAGKVVYKQPALSVETNINISHLAKGIYVVTCVLENGTTTVSKLLVQ